MEYNIAFDNVIDAFVVKTSGKMSGGRFVDMAEDLLGHLQWTVNRNVMFDHTELDFSGIFVEDLERIRFFHRENKSRIGAGKSAIVVKPGFLQKWHELWEHGQKIQTENKVMVFDNLNDAIQWIK